MARCVYALAERLADNVGGARERDLRTKTNARNALGTWLTQRHYRHPVFGWSAVQNVYHPMFGHGRRLSALACHKMTLFRSCHMWPSVVPPRCLHYVNLYARGLTWQRCWALYYNFAEYFYSLLYMVCFCQGKGLAGWD